MPSDAITILLVEDDADDAERIRQMLAQVHGGSILLLRADRLTSALEIIGQGGVNLIMLDLSLPDSRGLEAMARIQSRAPDVPILLLSSAPDEELSIKAMQAGAQDFLAKDRINGPALVRIIRFALERHRQLADRLRHAASGRKGRVLTFIGAKGGVGTTTVALNMAIALARRGKPVAAAELRGSLGTFALHLGTTPVETLSDLLELTPDRIDDRQVGMRLTSHPSGLHVLFAPQQVKEYREITAEHGQAIVQALASRCDLAIIDLPSHPSEANRAIVRRSEFVTLVVERESSSVFAGKAMMDLLKSWGISNKMLGAVVVNRTALDESISGADIRTQLGCEIVGMVAPGPELCVRALRTGSPVVLSWPDSIIGATLLELADRYAGEQVRFLDFAV